MYTFKQIDKFNQTTNNAKKVDVKEKETNSSVVRSFSSLFAISSLHSDRLKINFLNNTLRNNNNSMHMCNQFFITNLYLLHNILPADIIIKKKSYGLLSLNILKNAKNNFEINLESSKTLLILQSLRLQNLPSLRLPSLPSLSLPSLQNLPSLPSLSLPSLQNLPSLPSLSLPSLQNLPRLPSLR